MKIYFTVLSFALLSLSSMQAQEMNIGLKGGLNFSNIGGDDSNGIDSKIGYHIGLLSHFHISDRFGLQPEIMYSAQGGKSNDAKLNLDYINIPLLFQYMYDNGFRMQAGPQLGILTSAKIKDNNSNLDVKDQFKTIDFALSAGLSYVHPPSGFGVDARYNYGLSNINENSASKAYNRGFQIGVFYLFKHKS